MGACSNHSPAATAFLYRVMAVLKTGLPFEQMMFPDVLNVLVLKSLNDLKATLIPQKDNCTFQSNSRGCPVHRSSG